MYTCIYVCMHICVSIEVMILFQLIKSCSCDCDDVTAGSWETKRQTVSYLFSCIAIIIISRVRKKKTAVHEIYISVDLDLDED